MFKNHLLDSAHNMWGHAPISCQTNRL